MDFGPATFAFLESIGFGEMGFVLLIVLLLFGGEKLPEFARGLGKSMREFKKAAAGVEEEFKKALDEDEKKAAAASASAPTILPPKPAGTLAGAGSPSTPSPTVAPVGVLPSAPSSLPEANPSSAPHRPPSAPAQTHPDYE